LEESYEVSEPTIDSHIVKLKSTAPTCSSTSPRRNSRRQAIKKNAEIGWKRCTSSTTLGIDRSVIKPAGFENAQTLSRRNTIKDPTDAQWKNDAGRRPGTNSWTSIIPEANRADSSVMYAYNAAQGLVHVLKACR
jgi:branched-chain amino acid transport system substrate-binding protein